MRHILLITAALTWAAPGHAADIRAGFQAAIELNAELRGLVAQRAVIEARRQGAQAFLPAAPSILPSWRTTTFTQRTGFQEFEIGGEVPV
ncbi:MAG: hypothetical protein K2W84_01895, partial [Burkholderiales bacterium]|nr:hypothetical protein [Burkholderiales bacterium]